ncbi:hypothetical protein MIR68_011341 [Amoeboaphelidium protococcarum]|nr:hypothetical protein MIR68_011341 [Amoeboaphelidium protococcarum]
MDKFTTDQAIKVLDSLDLRLQSAIEVTEKQLADVLQRKADEQSQQNVIQQTVSEIQQNILGQDPQSGQLSGSLDNTASKGKMKSQRSPFMDVD